MTTADHDAAKSVPGRAWIPAPGRTWIEVGEIDEQGVTRTTLVDCDRCGLDAGEFIDLVKRAVRGAGYLPESINGSFSE